MTSAATTAEKTKRTVLHFTLDTLEDLDYLVHCQSVVDRSPSSRKRYLTKVIQEAAAIARNNGHRKKPPPVRLRRTG